MGEKAEVGVIRCDRCGVPVGSIYFEVRPVVDGLRGRAVHYCGLICLAAQALLDTTPPSRFFIPRNREDDGTEG